MKPDVFLKIPDSGYSADWLQEALGDSGPAVSELLAIGAIYADAQRIFSTDHLLPGQTLRVFPNPLRFPAELLTVEHILFNSENHVAVDKPAGLPSVPVASNGVENALVRAESLLNLKLYPAHRLDTDTKGVLLLGRSPESVHHFQRLHANGKVLKLYQTLTKEKVPLGLHEHWMTKGKGRMRMGLSAETAEKNLKKAVLEVLSCERSEGLWLSSIRLITGRTHQIRCQLAHLGCPLWGDPIYGQGESGGLRLLAHQLELDGLCIESRQQI